MRRRIGWITLLAVTCLASAEAVSAQPDTARGSRNVALVGHVAVEGGAWAVEIEQDPARPYAYVTTRGASGGVAVVSLATPDDPQLLLSWAPEEPAADPALRARDVVSFKLQGRQYLAQAFRRDDDGEAGLAAVVVDVTDLPDAAAVREAARLQEATAPGGFHRLFAYKHSDGRALLFATGGGAAHVYDLERLLAGDAHALVARIDTPAQLQAGASGFDDVFVGFEPETGQDRFYGAGAGGYYVFDVTDPANAVMLTSISSAAVQRGRAIAPTPDGRYAVTAAGYRTAPLRIFDLQPGLDGTIPRIRTAVGAWMADWRNDYAAIEVRWPFAFAAALEDGLQVFNLRDPVNPYTEAFYRTAETLPETPATPTTPPTGTVDVAVRNTDGLIVVADRETGFWAFRLEAFEGWHGHGWGLPNMSSAQDWDAGPDGK